MTTTPTEFSLPFSYKTNRKNPLLWLLSHTLHQWFFLLLAIIGAIGNALLASVPAIYFGEVFEDLIDFQPNFQRIIQISLIILISQVIRGILQFSRNYGFELAAQRMERNIREELYISLLGKSMTFHALQSVGDLMARATNDVREVNYMFSPGINMVFGSLNFLFIPLIVGARIHINLLIVPTTFIIFYILSIWHYLTVLKPITTEVRQTFGSMNSRLSEAIDGIETLKGAAKEEEEISLFKNNITAYRDALIRQGDTEAKFFPMLLLAIALSVGLFHALLLFNQGAIRLGDVITYFSSLSLLGFPTFVSIFAYSQISLGLASAKRILELINQETSLDENIHGAKKNIFGRVSFNDVCFRYLDFEPVLKNITFDVLPGQTVAIVGQTGAGKTSLVRLINRTYDIGSGSIKIDEIDLRDWNLENLRNQISIIEQDIFLFSRSISDNIAFGKPDASQEEVIAAAKAAQAHDFIMKFENGYDTIIGERGVTLSGGQRQRLALARAFITNPKILILDDSTSAIDSQTEDLIQKAIYKAAEGRTTFIITHRLSQIRWADLIIVLKKGEISAIGTHDLLIKTSKSYRQLFQD